MNYFVKPGSIVRTIWGDADTILLIFAGSAAEFALNRAVDWLFFTGKLPADPIARLFSTVRYAQEIVFAETDAAKQSIECIGNIHGGVEQKRGFKIPDWAYRDVLYMLIDYSERAYALLHRPLTEMEQEEVFSVFRRVGEGLHIPDLPKDYKDWVNDRQVHLQRDLVYSEYTGRLFERYRQQLGYWRYDLLLQAQSLLVPEAAHKLLKQLPVRPILSSTIWLYRLLRKLRLRPLIQRALLPSQYLEDIRQLERSMAA